MKHVLGMVLLVSLMGVVSACDDSPTDPTDETVTFTAQLSPANEVPPVSNAESTGSGTAIIQIDVDRDSAGAITAATANFQVTLTGFPAGTPLAAAHIHTGAAGANGPVLINTGLAANEVTLTNGTGGFTRNGVSVTGDGLAQVQAIINTPANFYFNVHSVQNPGGVARGQLVKQ